MDESLERLIEVVMTTSAILAAIGVALLTALVRWAEAAKIDGMMAKETKWGLGLVFVSALAGFSTVYFCLAFLETSQAGLGATATFHTIRAMFCLQLAALFGGGMSFVAGDLGAVKG